LPTLGQIKENPQIVQPLFFWTQEMSSSAVCIFILKRAKTIQYAINIIILARIEVYMYEYVTGGSNGCIIFVSSKNKGFTETIHAQFIVSK
jgi:hypothetical protein